uniref:Uncharacterized protein n=1 Tax=Romanomermis culicivorax TaxID=13658 RepID=A0A915JCY3_ROMCU
MIVFTSTIESMCHFMPHDRADQAIGNISENESAHVICTYYDHSHLAEIGSKLGNYPASSPLFFIYQPFTAQHIPYFYEDHWIHTTADTAYTASRKEINSQFIIIT